MWIYLCFPYIFFVMKHLDMKFDENALKRRAGFLQPMRNTNAPVAPSHLGHCDAALLGQLLFGFFTGVGVAEV